MKMEVVNSSEMHMVIKKTRHLQKNGWQKRGSIQKFTNQIPVKVEVTKYFPATTYYQELVKEDCKCIL